MEHCLTLIYHNTHQWSRLVHWANIPSPFKEPMRHISEGKASRPLLSPGAGGFDRQNLRQACGGNN